MVNVHNNPPLQSLVVVGSSAGGIEALSRLVATLPADFPAPLVLAQHLDPRHPSHLGEILARRSVLPVRTVTVLEHLEPGVVYVVPANRHVEITDHMVRLRADTGRRPKPSVDLLLTTAARVYGERLIAVVLTGTGSDGTAGARAVKATGGMVIIENPATAAYPGMPESLAPSTVDVVADLERIGPLLYDLLTDAPLAEPPEAQEEAALLAVLAQVRERSGIDFSLYKRPTILRCLQRRMVATDIHHLSDYASYLTQHPEEYARLIASFLINVTEFFRDPELFAALRNVALPDLIAQARRRGNELRIWSAGCATGEEAYSLAILVAEALGEELERFSIQIFATDLDEEAIAFARRGVFSASGLASVPDVLRARYFTGHDGAYEVTPRIRSLVTFGQHDLGQRAPFPRIDLVLCRNVLMYFTTALQRRTLHLFAFALRDGGYLALGKAETAKPLAAYFTPINDHVKLYRRHGERVLPPIERISAPAALPAVQRMRPLLRLTTPAPDRDSFATPGAAPLTEPPHGADGVHVVTPHPRSLSERLGNMLLDADVGVVVVDRDYDIQLINTAAMRLLNIYTVAMGKDLVHLASSVPATDLRAVIDAGFQAASRAATKETMLAPDEPEGALTTVTLETTVGERRRLQIACYPHRDGADAASSPGSRPVSQVMILVSDVTRLDSAQRAAFEAAAREQAAHLRAQTQELSDPEQALQAQLAETERLRAHLQEIVAVNRALVQANQEFATTNLNLQSANEDLLLGREETEASAEEIKTLNEELQATNEELVTVNEELEATVEELHTANEDMTARSQELQRLATSLESQRQTSDAARAQLEAILLSMNEALLVVDSHGARVLTNTAYVDMFGEGNTPLVAEDANGQPLPITTQLHAQAATGVPFDLVFMLTAADGSRRWFEAHGQPIRSDTLAHGGVVTIRDITERLSLLEQTSDHPAPAVGQ